MEWEPRVESQPITPDQITELTQLGEALAQKPTLGEDLPGPYELFEPIYKQRYPEATDEEVRETYMRLLAAYCDESDQRSTNEDLSAESQELARADYEAAGKRFDVSCSYTFAGETVDISIKTHDLILEFRNGASVILENEYELFSKPTGEITPEFRQQLQLYDHQGRRKERYDTLEQFLSRRRDIGQSVGIEISVIEELLRDLALGSANEFTAKRAQHLIDLLKLLKPEHKLPDLI